MSMIGCLPLQAGVDPATVGLGLLTQLGDTWFLALVAATLYWLGRDAPVVGSAIDRERAATVLALVFVGVALSTGLKEWFAVARPPGGLVAPTVPSPTVDGIVAWLAGADGYGFPSGHAVLATAGWGGLAWAIRRGSVRTRAAGAAAVVLAIGTSRVALGLHSPVQVLAGFAAGATALVAVILLGRATRGFVLAFVVAAVGVVAVGPIPELVAVAGLAGGATAAWYRWRTPLTARVDRGSALALAGGLVTVLPVFVWLASIDEPGVVHAVAGAVAGGTLVALPLVGAWFAKKRTGSADPA